MIMSTKLVVPWALMLIPLVAVVVVGQENTNPHEGRRLFNHETFGGNGRTCSTCHSPSNGTLTQEQIADRFAEDPNGPLFRGDGTDDGAGNGTSRIRADGTILVTLPLPAHVRLADDPGATTVTLRRGIPSTMNTPALDPVLMYDGRAPDLVEQARGAIADHAAHTIEPTEEQLQLIAEFPERRGHFSRRTRCTSSRLGGRRRRCPRAAPNRSSAGDAFSMTCRSSPPRRVGSAPSVTAARC
jgi:hypothetical protein